MIALGQRAEVGLHADQGVLGGRVLNHVTAAAQRRGTALAFCPQVVLGVHQAQCQLPPFIVGQVGRVVIGGRHAAVEEREGLGAGHIAGQHAVVSADLTHIGADRLHADKQD